LLEGKVEEEFMELGLGYQHLSWCDILHSTLL